MQYIIKAMMVSFSNGIIGAFAGMFLKIMYGMMIGQEQTILGMVFFFVGIGVLIGYSVLLKKFVTGKDISITIPVLFLLLGVWLCWKFYVAA